MKIAINNTDYTAALDGVRPLTVERKLNAPSTCSMWLTLPWNGSLPVPQRNQAVAVTGNGPVLRRYPAPTMASCTHAQYVTISSSEVGPIAQSH